MIGSGFEVTRTSMPDGSMLARLPPALAGDPDEPMVCSDLSPRDAEDAPSTRATDGADAETQELKQKRPGGRKRGRPESWPGERPRTSPPSAGRFLRRALTAEKNRARA